MTEEIYSNEVRNQYLKLDCPILEYRHIRAMLTNLIENPAVTALEIQDRMIDILTVVNVACLADKLAGEIEGPGVVEIFLEIPAIIAKYVELQTVVKYYSEFDRVIADQLIQEIKLTLAQFDTTYQK